MRTYARIASGAVAELLATDQDITHLFHPSLRWVEVTGRPVETGWVAKDGGFAPPPAPDHPAAPAQPTIAELHARLDELAARVAALAPRA